MARSPQQLLTTLRGKNRELADRVEAEIDRKLDAVYAGGVFTHVVFDQLAPPVWEELCERYREWDVSFTEEVGQDRHEKVWMTTIRMKPSPPVPF